MKKKVSLILLTVLLLVPTWIALVNYLVTSTSESLSVASYVEITPPGEQTYRLSRRANGDGYTMINLLADAIDNAERSNPAATSINALVPFTVTFDPKSELPDKIAAATYIFYVSPENTISYVKDHNGYYYELDGHYIEEFLSSRYAASLYTSSQLPTLTVAGDRVVPPQEAEWSYRTYGDRFAHYAVANDEKAVYAWNGNPDLTFDIAPTTCRVKVYEGNKRVFDGTLKEYHSSGVGSASGLRYEIMATWDKTEDARCYGSCEYHFSYEAQDPATFYLETDAIVSGEFTVITGKQVAAPDSIVFSSEPSLDFEPLFFRDGEYIRALLPVDTVLAEPTVYTITLSYGGTQTKLTLTVSPRESVLEREYDDTAIPVGLSEANKKDYQSLQKVLFSSWEGTRYFQGPFYDYSDPSRMDATLVLGFGHHRTLTSGTAGYRMNGVDFFAALGENIPAANNGKVIYTGSSPLTGNLVVIDHGLGLKTWYMHLSEITVNNGTIVKTGDLIGKTGKTGFTNLPGFYFMTTVKDVPVSPYTLWVDGVKLSNP